MKNINENDLRPHFNVDSVMYKRLFERWMRGKFRVGRSLRDIRNDFRFSR